MTELQSETRDERYLRQTSELYEGLGRFVAAFELIVDAMRTQLLFVWSAGPAQNQVLYQPALAELAAHSVKNAFIATMAENLRMRFQDETVKAEAEKVLAHIAGRLPPLPFWSR